MREAELWRTLAGWIDEGHPCALCTVVRVRGAAPRRPGARLVVRGDGASAGTVGGGALELEVTRQAREVLAAGEPRLLSFDLEPDLHMLCGGQAEVFIEPMQPPDRLYLFGAGHIGQALAPMAARLGFAVTVIDDRPAMASPERFPEASGFVGSFAATEWSSLPFDLERTYCVVVSPSHAIDFEVARELLRRPSHYVGMIGSRKKRRATEESLRAAGINVDRIADLHSPIGEPIGAETPEEIAVSILAELVRVRRLRGLRPAGQAMEQGDG